MSQRKWLRTKKCLICGENRPLRAFRKRIFKAKQYEDWLAVCRSCEEAKKSA